MRLCKFGVFPMSISYQDALRVFEEADCLHGEQEVYAAIDKLAADVTADLRERNPLVFTIMNGGLIAAGILLPKLRFPLRCEYLHATRYCGGTSGKSLTWVAKPSEPIAGQTILIIDDILDEGYTLAEVVRYCREQGAAEVKVAVLVDKLHDRKAPDVRADYVGLKVADRYLFGFGMDYKGYWRNAPGIYAVKGL